MRAYLEKNHFHEGAQLQERLDPTYAYGLRRRRGRRGRMIESLELLATFRRGLWRTHTELKHQLENKGIGVNLLETVLRSADGLVR